MVPFHDFCKYKLSMRVHSEEVSSKADVVRKSCGANSLKNWDACLLSNIHHMPDRLEANLSIDAVGAGGAGDPQAPVIAVGLVGDPKLPPIS